MIDLRERGRERNINSLSTYLCIHWLILVCALTRRLNPQPWHIRTTISPNELLARAQTYRLPETQSPSLPDAHAHPDSIPVCALLSHIDSYGKKTCWAQFWRTCTLRSSYMLFGASRQQTSVAARAEISMLISQNRTSWGPFGVTGPPPPLSMHLSEGATS